ncbi:MAG: sigma-70 family RNA polymerase sigma factor [Tannerella sp.]|jgi:RNA polymerase sigma-70 factor (ECF subfamily)|nr:sigma-70 family RNA polymerase sigma factor [Tannerella sp.]
MNISDETLWLSCIDGRKEGFHALYTRYYLLMFNYGMKFVADAEFVKDCIHDVFIKLIQNHKSLPQTRFVKGYLLRACKNKIYDELKKEHKTEDIALYENLFLAEEFYDAIHSEIVSDADMRRLLKAYWKISTRQQEIIYLYFIRELSHEDIMGVMNINYQSSKNLLFRAVKNLKKGFEEE